MNWITELPKVERWKRYSQCGEESIIGFILSKIESTTKFVLDLGAGDGYSLSNSKYFIESHGFAHLLVDGNNHGNKAVMQHFLNRENILPLLKTYGVPKTFDLFCIDLDGNDIYILDKVLSEYQPSIIVAEFNPIFEKEVSAAIRYNSEHRWEGDDYYGFSFTAGVVAAKKHGYSCVFQTDNMNMYFVKDSVLAASMNVSEDSVGNCIPKVEYKVVQYHPMSNRQDWVEFS